MAYIGGIRLQKLLVLFVVLLISACGGGGGGIGGGLIPGLMTLNTIGVMSGDSLQIVVDGGLAPYTFSFHTGLGGSTAAPWGGATIDPSGLLTIPDIGDDIDIVIIKVVDDLGRKKYFRIPVLGQPMSWYMASKVAAVDTLNGGIATLVDQSGNGNDATGDCVAGECPALIGADSILNNWATMSFDGINDQLLLSNNVVGDITIALVYKAGAGLGASGWAGNSGIIQNTEYGISLAASGAITAGTNTGTNREFASATGHDDNQPHIVLITKGADSRVYVDSIGVGGNQTSGGGKSAGGNVYLGSNGIMNYFTGAIPEILIYQRDLGGTVPAITEDRVTLIRYLKEKYKVSLPAVPPPTVTITSAEPFDTDGSFSTNTSASFDYTYTASPYADIYKVECQLDGGAWVDCRNPDQFISSHTKEYSGLADGVHTFTVKATDVDEKEATDTNSWTSDNTAPVCNITGTAPVDDLSDGWGDLAAFDFQFVCSDLSPFAAGNPECSLDGGVTWNPCTTVNTQVVAGLSTNDTTTFIVRAMDSLGNGPGTEETVTWTTDLEAPTCTIASAPSGVRTTNSETINFNCADTPPGVLPGSYRVQCSFDGGAYTNCDSNTQHTLTGLVAGTHTFDIKVFDQGGRPSIVQNATWITDLAEPVCVFTTVPGTFGGLDPQIIEFNCSDDSDAAPTIECSLDSGVYAPCTSTTTFNVTNATEGKLYTVDVRATDHAARVSTIINTSWTCDLTDPVCSIDVGTSAGYDPPDYTTTSIVNYDCADSAGTMPMDRADCSLDGGAWATCSGTFSSGTGAKSGSHTMTGLAGGNHTLDVRGYDSAGRYHEISHNFRNDIGRPTCTIVTVISGDRNNASEAISVQCDDDIALNDPAPSNPQCKLDDITAGTSNVYNGDCGATAFAGSYNATATYNTGALTDGRDYQLTLTITDSGGKVPVSDAVATWTTDISVPTCTITTSPDGLVHTWNYEDIAFTCDDNSLDFTPRRDLTIECEIDGGGFSACDTYSYQAGSGDYQGTHQFPGLLAGNHTLKVRATDSSGNISTETVSVTTADFTTDLADPSCSITVSPLATGVGYSNDATPTFNYTCTDDGDADNPRILTDYECLLDDVVIGTGCDSMITHTLTALAADGQYKFDVRVTDVAGKVSAAESITWDYDGTQPTCSITSGQSGYLSNPSETFDYSCSDPVINSIQSDISTIAQYECALDDNVAGWIGCDTALDHTFATADGAHTFYLRVTDDAGNTSNEQSVSWITDDTTPTVDSLILSRPACSNCSAGFTNSTDNIRGVYTVTEVNPLNFCIRNDNTVGSCVWSTDIDGQYDNHTLTGGDGVKTVYVWMRDDAMNVSSSRSQTIELDTTAPNTPTVTIDGGANYATATGVSVGFTSTDANGNSRDVCHRLDTAVGSCSWTGNVTSPDAFTLAASDGSQTVYTWIRDAAGNVSNFGQDSIILDRVNPTCTISTGSGTYQQSTSKAITYSCSDATSGVATRQCKLNSGPWVACSGATTHTFSGLTTNATNTLRVRAVDSAGLTGAEDSITVINDTIAPTVTITGTQRVDASTRRFNFTNSDAGSGVNAATRECRSKNGGAAWTSWGACTASTYHNVTVTAGNIMQYETQVEDNVGNLRTSTTTSETAIRNGHSAAECTGDGGTVASNYCQFGGTACAATANGWGIQLRRYNARTCNPANAAAGTSSCTTDSTAFYASAPTCGYTDNDNWSWSSYGNPAGYTTATLSNGTSAAGASCTKTAYTTPCDAWGVPVADVPTDCVSPGRCCRTACSPNNSGRTCTATVVNTVRCQ